jgi:hypothetical protein
VGKEDTWRQGTLAGCIQTKNLRLDFSRVVFLHGEGPVLSFVVILNCESLSHQQLDLVIFTLDFLDVVIFLRRSGVERAIH